MKYNLSKNIYIIIIFIIIISILYLFYKKYNISKKEEHYSNGLLDLLEYKGEPIKYNIDESSTENTDEKKDKKEDEIIYKHIFLKNNNENISFEFYNKKMENYLFTKGTDVNNIKIKTIDNTNIGYISHFKYNTFTTNYDDNNVDYTLLYNDKRLIKIMYENDIYYIIEDVKNKKYKIYLFELNIGNINKINNNTYKIVIDEKYKIVLNNIAFGLIIELLRNKF